MIRMLLAALALACVCSPAMAGTLLTAGPAAGSGFTALGILAVLVGFVLFGLALRKVLAPEVRDRLVVASIVAIVMGAGSAFAAEGVAPTPGVVIPYGDWLVAIAHALTEVLVPVLVAVLTAAIGRVAPWAVLLLSQQRIEAMVRATTAYGLNAVEGAAKGKTLSVPVAAAVIAKAVQRAEDVAPKRVVEKAGGLTGVAERVFRTLDLESGATAANVLEPVLRNLGLAAR